MKTTLVTLAAVAAVTNAMNGEEACEGRGLDRRSCEQVGCCHFSPQLGCMSSVGQNQCHDRAAPDGPSNGKKGKKGGKGKKSKKSKRTMRRLHMLEDGPSHHHDGPSRQDIRDLATLAEEEIMLTTDIDAVMAETGLNEDELAEFGADVVVDLVANLPEDKFYKLQLEILSERLGDLEFEEDHRRLDNGPTIDSILEDIMQLHEDIPADAEMRRMGKKGKKGKKNKKNKGGAGGQPQAGAFPQAGGQPQAGAFPQAGAGAQAGGQKFDKSNPFQWVSLAGGVLGGILNTVGTIGTAFRG